MRAERILSWSFYCHPVVLEALAGVEVEDKEHIRSVKHNDLVPFMLGADKGLQGEERKKLIKYFFMNTHYLPHLGLRNL